MVNPSKWVNLKSNFLKFHHRNQAISGIEKARKMAYFRAFLALLSCRLSLAELRSATSGFEAVLLALLHSGVAGQETGLLQNGTHLIAVLQQRTGNTVTDSAGLAGNAAACYGADNIKLTQGIGEGHGLTNDQLQGLQTKVIVDVTAVDGDAAGAVGEQVHAGHGLSLIHISEPTRP